MLRTVTPRPPVSTGEHYNQRLLLDAVCKHHDLQLTVSVSDFDDSWFVYVSGRVDRPEGAPVSRTASVGGLDSADEAASELLWTDLVHWFPGSCSSCLGSERSANSPFVGVLSTCGDCHA